jgi:Leucine-rich repeat (LRR) protein
MRAAIGTSALTQKKIKLYRKENEELKHELARQVQQDASLLLNSKELSEANSKLEAAINDISLKL